MNHNLKKLLALLLTLVLVFSMAGCSNTTADESGNNTSGTESGGITSNAESEGDVSDGEGDDQGEPTEIIVFAAASMTETLNTIKETYEADHNVNIVYNFDSSGTLKSQIQEGADCDLFISAGQKQMNQLDINADSEVNTEGLDFVDADSRIDLLENKVTLCVPDDNDKNINSFDDLKAALEAGDVLLAMGNEDVPVGQYTQKILAYYELDEAALANAGLITYGSNVKEVTTQVSEGSVDCGVIYCTDAYSAGLTIVDYATPEMCGQVIYPAAVLKTAQHPDEAQEFLNYLTSEEAMSVFEEVGFSPVA
jgi:molybdate transport system substrate-binding protein